MPGFLPSQEWQQVVLDKQGIIRYTELVEEVTQEPNYDAALGAVKELL